MFPFKRKKDEKKKEPVEPIRRRKKKEEPPKPWGKLERIIVFVLLTSIPAISTIFFLNSKKTKISQTPVEPPQVLSLITNSPKDTKELKAELESEIKNLKGKYGIWVQVLDGSFTLGINENDQFEGASLFKLPMMLAYYKEVDKENLNPESTYTLKFSDAAGGSGTLANMPAGTVITYRDIIRAMGQNSDNSAFQIMGNILGFNAELRIIQNLSMQNTDFVNSLTTPYDMGNLFYKVTNTNIISENSKKEFISFLKKTDSENLLPAGVPSNIQVAHKYGNTNNNLNDAGIIYTTKPYILIVLSKDVDLNEAKTELPKISKLVYDWIK